MHLQIICKLQKIIIFTEIKKSREMKKICSINERTGKMPGKKITMSGTKIHKIATETQLLENSQNILMLSLI